MEPGGDGRVPHGHREGERGGGDAEAGGRASPGSKLSIFRNNPDIKELDSIKVNLLESPGVSPPHSAATSPSPSNTLRVQRSGGRKIVKETFILNPFKRKPDGGPFKKLDPSSKVCTVIEFC